MIKNKKALLKQYFFTGAKPSQEEFADLVECIAILLSDKSLRIGFEHLEVDDSRFLAEYILDVIGDVRINGNMVLEGEEGSGGFTTSNIDGGESDNGILHLNQGTGQPVTIGNEETEQGDLIVHGRLGIGTTSPSMKLEVDGKSGFSDSIGIRLPVQEGEEPALSTEPEIPLAIGDPDSGLNFERTEDADNPFSLQLVTNDRSRIKIDGHGNITLGSPSPDGITAAPLEFEIGNDNFPYNLTVSGTSTLNQLTSIGTDPESTFLSVNGKSEFLGNVGIGAASNPALQLSLGDNKTGLEGSEQQLELKTNSKTQLKIDLNGNVSMGAPPTEEEASAGEPKTALDFQIGNEIQPYNIRVTGISNLEEGTHIGTATDATNLTVTGNTEFKGNVGIGNLTNPAIQLTLGDNNTGLEGSANSLELKTNGKTHLTIDSWGNLNLGADTANEEADSAITPKLQVGNDTVSYDLEVKGKSSLANEVSIGSDSTATNLKVTGKSEFSANVGIGVSNPSIQLTLGDNNTGIEGDSQGIRLKTVNQDRLSINAQGAVAIGGQLRLGADSETEFINKLAVNGNANIKGKLDVGNENNTSDDCLDVNGISTFNGQPSNPAFPIVTVNGNLEVTGNIINHRDRMVLGREGGSDGSLVVHGTIEATAGDITSSGGRIKDKRGYVMPVGSIIAYGGTDVPTGWLLCDGQTTINGPEIYQELYAVLNMEKTPDLQSRFIVGAGQKSGYPSYALHKTVDGAGNSGQNSVTLTSLQMPRHTHTGTTNHDGAHNHTHYTRKVDTPSYEHTYALGATSVNHGDINVRSNNSSHSHHFTTNPAGGNTNGRNDAHENRPPFYALRYIIKY